MQFSRFAALFLTLALSLGLISCRATAAQPRSIFVGGIELVDNTYLPSGGTMTQSTCPSGGYAFYSNGVLTLKDFSYEGLGLYNEVYDDYSGIYAEGDLSIRAIGENLIDVTAAGDQTSYGILADSLTVEAGPFDCLTIWGTYCGINTVGDKPYVLQKGGTIYAYGDAWGAIADITLEAGSVMLSNGDYYDDLYEGNTSYGALFGTLDFASNLFAYGSEDPEGRELVTYTEADLESYDYISVEGQSIHVAGVEMTNRTYLPVGETELSFYEPTGGYAFYANGSLLLNNFSYEGKGYYDSTWGDYSGISAEIPLQLQLVGENRLVVTGTEEYLSYGLVAASLVISGERDSSLFLSANYAGINTTSDDPTMVLEEGQLHSTGDYWGAIADITVKGGSLILQNRDISDQSYHEESPYRALYGSLSVHETMEIQGAEDPAGEGLLPYVRAHQDRYDYIRVTPKAQEPALDSNIRFNHTLDLASDISINFAIAKSLLTGYDMDSAYVECEISDYTGNSLSGTTSSILYPTLRGSYYYFTFTGLNAVRMNDLVTARFHGMKDGSAYVSQEDTYSVSAYACAQLSKTSVAQKLQVLCANLLRYGSMAQQYKSYRTDALPDSTMTAEQKALLRDLSTVTFDSVNRTVEPLPQAAVSWAGKALNLDSKVTIKYIVNLSNYQGEIKDLSLRLQYTAIDGSPREQVLTEIGAYNAALGQYAFDFDGLLAAELRQTVRAAVYCGEERLSATLEYSASTYGGNKTGPLLELCKCLMAYSDAAKDYFA